MRSQLTRVCLFLQAVSRCFPRSGPLRCLRLRDGQLVPESYAA
ncbi:MAG TPA: hypothetical protein VFS67_32975 [Polyangiaceae bacterium]|nr:hypothetical protein [Polyangiaceae bacterium]